jgi:predicted nucleic acid-binding protein
VSLIVDTDVLIGVLRHDDGARAAIEAALASDERLLSVAAVRTEVLRGVLPGEEVATTTLLDALDWISLTPELADRAGELGRRYRATHPGIDLVDLVVAAAAQETGAGILTRNVRHFPMFPGLRPAF